MIIKLKSGEVDLTIPTETPGGNKVKTIGIWASGGLDSTILLYLVCKTVRDQKLDIKIQPYSVRRPRPTNPIHAAYIIDKIEEMLDYNMLEHINYYPRIVTQEEKDYANGNIFIDKINEHFATGQVQLMLSGKTMNPPQEVQKHFRDGVNKEEETRGWDSERQLEWYFPISESRKAEFWQIDMFLNIDKSGIAELYEIEGVTDDLLPLTRSCETDESLHEHCGECWWCEERFWAFGRLI